MATDLKEMPEVPEGKFTYNDYMMRELDEMAFVLGNCQDAEYMQQLVVWLNQEFAFDHGVALYGFLAERANVCRRREQMIVKDVINDIQCPF